MTQRTRSVLTTEDHSPLAGVMILLWILRHGSSFPAN